MNLLFFVVGNSAVHYSQCYFSIMTFLKHGNIDNIYIYTDAPEFFGQISTKVTTVEITKDQVKEWRGEHDFFWRIKIKVIEDLAKRSDLPLVYLDTDTFLYQSSDKFLEDLNNGKAFMHLDEGSLKKMKHTPLKMWHQVKGKTFGGITIKENMHMWNAGVVAVPTNKREESIKLALAICDDMCGANVTPRLIEQYALGVALYHVYELKPAENFIGHYWGNKPDWNVIIDGFLLNEYLKGHSLEESVDNIGSIDFFATPIFKHVSSRKPFFDKLLNKMLVKKPKWLSK